MNLRAIVASALAAFSTCACVNTPTEPKRQTGELVTDKSGCTYWKDDGAEKNLKKTCLSKDTPTPPKL